MREIKVWPHLTIIAVICAVAAGVGVGLWMKGNRTASDESVLTAGRIQRVDGDVSVSALTNNASEQLQWSDAAANTPFSAGDRIYTNDNSQASLAFSGRNFARLQPNTSLDVLSMDRRRTQLALRDGSAMFDVGYLEPGQVFEVGTPYGAVDFNEPGLYDVGIGDNGNVIVSALSGLAQVVGLGGTGQISKGEMLTLLGQTAAEIALSRINGRDAGYLVDDYYSYQYPQSYDGRYSDYNTYVNDPYYFDPYRRNISYQYASPSIPGLNDLDYYGDWQNVNGYGYAWTPRVSSGWSPYQQGYWTNDYPYGPTWVSSEPWGYAPYHYGRWASVGDRWYWVPDGVNTTPTYSPALVAFLPFNDNTIGWVPLGPGDPYVARYYDDNWQPHYLTRGDVAVANLANFAVPNAVTVVPLDALSRPIDPRAVMRVSPQTIAQVRPTLEPLLLTPLRHAALNSAWGRGKIDLPPGIAKKLHDTPVVVNAAPLAPPFKKDLAKNLRVEKAKNQKLNVRDERSASTSQPDANRRTQADALAGASVRGNKEERQEVKDQQRQARELEQQQRRDQREQRLNQQKAMPPVRGERVGNPEKPRPQPQVQRAQPQAPPRNVGPPPQAQKHERQAAPAAPKQGGQQQPPGQGGGKGKGKKP